MGTLFPHLERQGGNRLSWMCTEVLRTLAQTPQLERQGGNRPLWKRPGRYAPRASAAARAAQAENLPLSQFHMRSTVQDYRAQ